MFTIISFFNTDATSYRNAQIIPIIVVLLFTILRKIKRTFLHIMDIVI
jgi:hypothetical protein